MSEVVFGLNRGKPEGRGSVDLIGNPPEPTVGVLDILGFFLRIPFPPGPPRAWLVMSPRPWGRDRGEYPDEMQKELIKLCQLQRRCWRRHFIGFAGLGVDMAISPRHEKRLQQTAADSAAIAAAAELPYGSAGVAAAAKHDSASNGFTDGGTGCPGAVGCVTVTVNNPPVSGPNAHGWRQAM